MDEVSGLRELTTDEAAARAGVTPQTIRNLANSGQLPARISRGPSGRQVYRFDEAAFEVWVARRNAERQTPRVETISDLRAQVRVLERQINEERTGRILAEAEINRLRTEVERLRRAFSAFLADDSDPRESLIRTSSRDTQ